RNRANRSANGLHSAALILTTMRRQQNTSEATITGDICLGLLECEPQRIDPCVPGKKHARGINALSAQIRNSARCWTEMPIRNPTHHDPIELLWEGCT